MIYSLAPKTTADQLHNAYNKNRSSKLGDLGLTAETVDYNKPVLPQIANADILVNGLGRVDKTIIYACPNLKLVHQIGTGIDNVDVDYCPSKSVYVSNVPGINNVSVAEHTLFLMIYLAKNMKSVGTSLMKRKVVNILGSELKNKTLVIVVQRLQREQNHFL